MQDFDPLVVEGNKHLMHREKIVHLLCNCWEEGRLPGTLFLDEQWPKKSWIEFPPTEGVHHLWSSSDDFRCNLVYHILSFNPLRQSTTYDVLKVISLFLFIPFSASTLSSQTRVSEISAGKSINLSPWALEDGGLVVVSIGNFFKFPFVG